MFCQKCGTQNPDNGKFCRACGNVLNANAVASSGELHLRNTYVDRRGRIRSNDPDDVWSCGIRNALLGVGFLVISIALLTTNVAGGRVWWWAMLFPAFSLLATGISNLAKAKRLERKRAEFSGDYQNQVSGTAPNAALPPTSTDYVSSTVESRYKTGDLVPPSVTEGTTRHLEMNSEGETMTLPKR